MVPQVWYLHIIQSEISQEKSKIKKFYERSFQPIVYTFTMRPFGLHSMNNTVTKARPIKAATLTA